jgi:hypothetical protein
MELDDAGRPQGTGRFETLAADTVYFDYDSATIKPSDPNQNGLWSVVSVCERDTST